MMGLMIAYRLKPPHNPNTASGLVKMLYGQNTSSHKGRYKYRRKGLLDTIPSHRLIRGVIVIRKEDKNKVLSLLNKFEIDIHIREVILTPEDIKALGLE